MKLMKTLAMVAGLAAGASAYAAGNIYEIVPCQEDGTVINYPVKTIDDPLIAGDTIYFKVRMARTMAMKATGDQWKYDYVGTGSPTIDEFFSPLKIGIFVSGKLTYASYVNYVDDASGDVRDFIFSYTTKEGDFALPIRLAGSDGMPAGYGDSASEYLLLNTDKWQIVDADGNPAKFQYGNAEMPVTPSYTKRLLDYTLAESGFHVTSSIRFDKWEEEGNFWRIVNSGGTSLTPRLITDSAPSSPVTLYVWSMDDNIVSISDGTQVDMIVDYESNGTPIKKTTRVGTVTLGASQTVASFKITGGPVASVGMWTNLVLSAFPNYSFKSGTNARQVDYVTVPVKCTDPLPPTVKATMDIIVGSGSTVYASSDYLKPVATVTLSVTEPPPSPFTVTLNPSFSGDKPTVTNWWDYVYFADVTELNDEGELSEFSESTKTHDAPTVEFTPTVTTKTFYLIALKSDDRTNKAGHQMKFTPEFTTDPYGDLNAQSAACYIQALPADGTMAKGTSTDAPLSVVCNDLLSLKIKVEDTYADMISTNGYTLTVSLTSTGALVDPDPITNLVVGAGGYLYVANADGTASSTLPTVKYGLSTVGSDPDYFTSSYTLTSPVSGLTSDPVQFYVKVAEKTKYRVAITNEGTGEEHTSGTPAFNEGDEITFTVTLNSPNMLGQTIYAYLEFKTDFDEAAVFEADDEEFIVGMANLEGIPIGQSETVAEGTVRLLDNAPERRLQISKVYFSFDSTLDATNMTNLVSYDYDTANSVTRFTIDNVEPLVSKIKIGTTSLDPSTVYTTKIPLDSERRFTAVVKDVLADLNATNTTPKDLRFETLWTTWCYQIGDGESVDDYTDEQIPGLQFEQMDIDGEGKTLYGNPNNLSFTNTFEVAGIWKICCQLRDKDMDEPSDEYCLYLKVTDAGVSVSQLNDFDETDRSQQLSVSLNYWDNQFAGTVFVALKVKSNAPDSTNLGRLKFNDALLWTNVWTTVDPFELSDAGTVTNAADAAADYYLLSFSSRNQLTQKLSILDADGVNDSFTYNAYVVSAQRNGEEKMLPASGKLAASYYAPSEVCQATLFNVDPIRKNIRVSPNPDESTNVWTSAKTITWTVTAGADVSGDFAATNGLTVSIIGDGVINNLTTNIHGAASGQFTPNFGSASGSGEIVMTVTDKDGGYQEWVWRYDLPPSKSLVTTPNGPTGIGNSGLSQKYVNADGRGRGHMFVVGANAASAVGFNITWTCTGLSEVPVYGYGYRVGKADNGHLDDGNDQALTDKGAKASKAADANITTGYYLYSGQYGGYEGLYDSYLYAWLVSLPTTDTGTTEWNVTLAPESPAEAAVPANALLPSDTTGDKQGYVPVKVEAAFSREWLPADNLGDINLDGVPDIFAVKYWRNNANLLGRSFNSENDNDINDLIDLAASNPDLDKLPGVYSQSGTLGNVNGYNNSYAPVGIDLATRMEIRGFDTGLNDWLVTKSDISFSDDELFAWTNLITSAEGLEKGYSTTNEQGEVDFAIDPNLTIWTPEPGTALYPRMDPTLEDTDEDGYPDGWEYFFWYQAKVWLPAFKWRDAHPNDLDSNGNKLIDPDSKRDRLYPGQPRAGQFFIFERFTLDNIVKGVEIPASEVMKRFDPCTPYNAEAYEGLKPLKYDFDNDGLSDLEELVLGTNPCHWDTDGDRLCDAWEVMMCLDPIHGSKNDNPDGDFMAYFAVRHAMCWINPNDAVTDPTAEGVRIYVMPNLENGIDYSARYDTISDTTKFVMLRTVEVTDAFSFTPKFEGPDGSRERVVYGLREDIPNPVTVSWICGGYMVDRVVSDPITLQAGTEIIDGQRLLGLTERIGYVLVHDQVRDAFGFDPRTGWGMNVNGFVSDRWDPAHNGKNVNLFSKTGKAVNTRPYSNYDEYLVMKYRLGYNIDYSPMTVSDGGYDPNKEAMWSFIRRKTTNPNVVYPTETADDSSGDGSEGDGTASASTNETAAATIAKDVAAAFNQARSDKSPVTTHGADTDLDGVPDGWELYMYRNPNAGPIADDENPEIPNVDHDDDELSWAEEYAGVDSCDAYKGCESIYKNHPGNNKGWWNKFFPTNPGTMKYGSKTADDGRILYAGDKNEDGADTDGDGVKDALEGGAWSVIFANDGIRFGDHQVNVDLSFVYGNPSDNGLTVCFRGGGMNPCTIDTDLDGLPDGWEMQHAGVPVELPSRNLVTPRSGKLTNVALDDATFIADGVFREGYNLSSNVVYIAGGMDATWGGDAAHDEVNDPEAGRSWDDLLGTARDVDFDHDGLQNYQEYMTQAMRHFRYDDVTTPLMGRILTEGGYHVSSGTLLADHEQSFGKAAAGGGSGNGFPVFDPASAENTAANAAEAWYGRSFVYYETVTTGVQKVVKVINDITGESNTNYTYYTAQKKRFKSGAALVADRVAHGGNGYQQPWTADGWRNAGYFAPPRHSWDRATASGKFLLPLYMYPITEGFMVASDISIAGYATTDPRIADTDADGMDDYYEMFHGLNPLLGTTPANANDTEWLVSKGGDIISAQFYMKNINGSGEMTLSTFNAWRNEWIYPSFSGIAGRDGNYLLAGTEWIAAPQAYDPVMYPWGMGSPMVDADGDGVRNDEERILANVADPVHRHTDPTPLWFTERTTPSSYVAQYYVLPDDLKYMPWGGSAATVIEAAALDANAEATHDLYNGMHYAFGFEENEGYDTDGDMTPDSIEFVKMVRSASDPLRFDDPTRRQALYLDGDNSFAMSRDLQLRSVDSEDFLKQFTVECWFLPERTDVEQTIIDRSVAYEGDSINTAMIAVRSNFRIGLTKDGHVYGMFDNNDSIESGLDEPKSCQFVDGGPVQKDTWTHVALTFDGTKLVLYVDGILSASAATTLIPANGVVQILQSPSATNSFTASQYSCAPSAFFVGARPIKATKPSVLPNGVYALYPYYIDPQTGDHLESFDNLQDYFQGYVDEVRVWDGARTGDQILANYKKSIGYAEAKENRDDVFTSWYNNNGTRNNNDGKPNLPAELVLNFDFSTLPGAVDPEDVAKVPAGFYANVLSAASSDYLSNPDIDTTGLYNIKELKGSTKLPDGSGDGRIEGDLFVGWWKESLLHSTVYSDYRVVPWIKNTVSHLPLADGASPDSFIYSDNFGAVYTPATDLGVSSFAFQNTANPYSSVVFNQDRFYRVAHARIRLVQCGEAYAADYALACFQVRNNFTASADLIPMGGAYAKTCPELWDEGVADPWEQTRSDTNGDSIPDWWEKYARNNYSPDIDPSASIGWETIVKMKFGDNVVELPAGKAYVIDLYRGMQPGGDIDPAYASNVDADANGIPDWWENLFGVTGHSGDDDVDSDGLSNYAEYLFSFGPAPYGLANGYPLLDPANQRTGAGQKVTDYFLAAPANGYTSQGVTHVFPNMYLGAIATDHDFMEDWWESNYSIGYANPRQYDPLLDRDEDGWSNWAEAKAFNWYNTFTADIIDAFYTRKEHRDNHPKPAVGVRLTYYGQQNIREATAIVRTSNGSSQRMDSKFVIPSIGLGTYQFVGGIIVNSTMHGYLTPGYLLPHSVCFYKVRNASINNYIWTWEWYEENKISHPTVNEGSRDTFVYYLQRWPHIYLTAMDANWGEAFARGLPNSDGSLASIVHTSTGKEIGLVNLVTGEWELDTTLLAEVDDDPDTLSLSVLRIGYDRRPGLEWPKTFWLSDTESNKAEDLWELETGSRYDLGSYGYIKEGKNTVEAFIDLDADGAYTAGEPYGVVKDVDVGWHKTAEVVIELKDTTSIVPRINLVNGGSDRAVVDGAASSVVMGGGASESEGESGDSAGNSAGVSKTVRIIRTAINGQESRARQVMAHTYVLDDRPYITEADVLSEAAGRFDLDWKFLAEDAMLMDTTPISADYSIVETFNLPGGGVTNTVLGTFTKTFKAVRPIAVPVAPMRSEEVYSASPTLSFTCDDETATAFRIQVVDNTGSKIVYDSGVRVLGGRSAESVGEFVHRFTPPIYADAPVVVSGAPIFKDGAEYKWRVALFNAAFPAGDDFFSEALDSADWSDWAEFTMDVGNERINPRIPTGYGKAGAIVRYYGPLALDDDAKLSDNIIVEAHATADFRSQPLAQARLSSADDIARRDDISTVNAVLKGMTPGKVYLMAYIDINNNGRRDEWESWGYVNFVGTTHEDVYTPKGITVVDSFTELPTAVIYIEDCDVNRNEIPDCLEPDAFLLASVKGEDADGDGLDSSEESDIGTDPGVWDSDGDGMPDGWEYKYSDNVLDPLDPDADLVGSEADVMAYAEIQAYLVTVKDAAATYDEGTVYAILDTSVPAPKVGDNMAGKKLLTTYIYGNRDDINCIRGVGREVTLPAGNIRITKVEANAKVALVHAQVYDWFGFNSKTCVADDDAVNTKVMTALDKYLVVRYLEAIGVQPTNDEKDASSVKWDACSGLEDWVNRNRKWDRYTLVAGVIDGDWSYDIYTDRRNGDGIADGWELYVMFQPDGVKNGVIGNSATIRISPWSYADARTASPSNENPAFRIVDEYDGGNVPTDPYSTDTDGDGINDYVAWKFQIKSAETQLADLDDDGLSNWAEYLAQKLCNSLGLGVEFDVFNPCSAMGNRLDYFYQVEQGGKKKYIGECIDADGKGLIADHDFVEDQWEDEYGVDYANRYAYDALSDGDDDGWSNWSEARVLTRPDRSETLVMDDGTVKEYPVPAIAFKVEYSGTAASNAALVVKAYSGGTTGAADATWVVSSDGAVVDREQILGLNKSTDVSVGLGPGEVVYGSVNVYFRDPNEITFNGETSIVSNPFTSEWRNGMAEKAIQDDSRHSNLGASGLVFGGVDYEKGVAEIDFGSVPQYLYHFDGAYGYRPDGLDEGETNSYVRVDTKQAYVKVAWKSRYIPGERGWGIVVSKADSGHVREGLNTFVAFCDVDGNGEISAGEPYGVVRDVNVGYDKVPEVKIALREDAIAFAVPAQSNATTRVRVVRTAINGEPLVKPRAVYAKTLDLSEGRTFTEVDFIKDGEYDFDWANLVTDATAAGLASAEAIRSATYAVYLGWGDPEPVYVFTKEFEMAKLAPAASGACAEHGYVVASARPTLMWQAREGYSAFALQIATDKNDFENTIVYDKPGFMPAATEEGCVFTPEFYVEDGKTYYWRVAQLNAKFKENKWSDITSFKAAIDSSNSDTGYGALAAEVRYFGPSAATIDKVVVGVYESADFASAPVARKSLSGADAVSSLVGDATKPFLEVKANVTLDGIAPGSYYVMAFIDTNGDKIRDPYESWGYACKIGTDAADKWTPVAVDVVSSKAAIPAALVVMEDTDVNQNWTPDCLEDMMGWIPASEVEPEQPAPTIDSDGDGLTDAMEDDYGTDPRNDDTDADGMPDGWEVRNGLDPLFNDADFALPLDYMAYAEHTVQVAVKGDKVYAVKTVTNEYGNVTSRVLYDTFELEDGTIIVGKANTGVTIAANTFYTTTTTNAVLIHSAVYDWFGFDPTTALPVAAEGTNSVMAANTAPFTAYWKYVTEVGYLKGLFNINYALNARAVDVNANGLPDGWELYVAFAHILAQGAQNTNTTFPMTGASLATAIAEFDEGRQTADPWDAHYFFKQLEDDEYVTPYTNVEARRYNIVDGDFMKDEDLDGLSNYNEFLALKKHNVTLDVHKAMSNDTTLDYFRKSTTDNTKYLGLALNGGEFIEEPARKAFGVMAYNMAGTRVMDDSGWDLWSEIRAYLANPENSLYGEAVSEEGVTNATAEIASLSLVKPVPTIPLTLRYFGNATKTVVVEAYQGRESVETVRWTVSAVFDGGVAKVTLGAADEGSLKQGKARFVAYFDESADGFTPDDAFGMDEVEIGWSGTPVDIRIGEATSLPFIELAGETNGAPISAAAIVRTAINGKRVEPRGIWRRVYANNVSRAVLHPGDFVSGTFIGVDPGLVAAAAQAGIDPVDIESATYEVLTGSRPYSITNLNSYVVSNEVVETGNDNQTFTYNYSLIRDVAYGLAYFDELAGSAGLTFTLPETPESLAYTKFWIKIGKVVNGAMTEYGGTRGFLLPNATEGHVTLDAERLAALGIPALTADEDWQFTVAVGNDKFGKPEADEYAPVAKFHVNRAANFDGKIKVVVKHPLITPAAANLVVAVYDSPDLANAVKVQRVTNVGNIEIAGLHENGEYYVAAWYVSANDARLGNDGMLERKPWDTWGYATELGEEEYCFAPKAYRANGQTVTFWLQDTDWNDNGIVDRTEKFLAEDGNLGPDKAAAIFTDFNLNGIDDDWELFNDEDPTFVDEGELVDDVMAYAELPAYLVTVKNNANAADLGTVYAIIDIPAVGPIEGDNMKGWTLWTTYDYGGKVGVGREVTIPDGDWRIIDIDRDATVVLVHAQVYQRFGFNTKTCVFDDDAVNTKHMTMLDKYLVVRYLENIGVRDPAMGLGATLEDWVVAGKRWGEYTLRTKSCDLDLDSVRDGWELYVMFGPYNELGNEAFHFAADKKASPWVYDDRTSDFDGDELPLYREYDDGYWPTDPWNVDTDGDHVFDVYAYTYHLKGNDAGKDADRDGLSNYAEYIVSEVFQHVKLDPDKAMTDDSTLDYYRKFGDLYLGELFTDHDRIDDDWEAQYEKGNLYGTDYAARGIYDPDLDLDGDGWSNYAEFRAGTSPARQTSSGIDNYTLIEHPVPVVQMEVVYNGTADIEGRTLTVKAWNEATDAAALSAPSATWTVTTLNESADDSGNGGNGDEATDQPPKYKYIGRMPTGKRTYYLGGGSVKEGSFKLCLKDKNYVKGVAVEMDGMNYFQATDFGNPDEALWFYNVIDHEGKLVTRGGIFAQAHEIGTIDYDSGRVTINFDDEEFTGELLVGDPEKDAVDSDSNKGNGQNAAKTYHGLNPPSSYVKFVWSTVANVPVKGVHYLGDTDSGFLREGLTTFVVEASSSSGTDTLGGGDESHGGQTLSVNTSATLYGVVRNVDVGWAGAKFTVELTDYNPITPRMDLVSGSADRVDSAPFSDYRVNAESNRLEAAEGISESYPTRVRVVRYAINGYPIVPTWGKGLADVIYDKTWCNPDRKFCELDFLVDGRFDIDWTDTFNTKVATENGVALGSNGDAGNIAQVIGTTAITNIEYLVVIGDGPTAWERGDDTNTVVTARVDRIVRRFDRTRAKPVPVSVDGIQYSARPTFKWRMDGEDPLASRFGSSYTAFKLQVLQGGNTVYDSGIRRAPKVDDAGNFVWTAPICAGSMLPSGAFYDTVGESAFTWRVIMYNAMFRSDSNDYWSDKQGILQFVTAVNAQQEVNDHGYSSIAVAVRYAGSSIVLAKCADMTTTKGKVIVQAFSTPDFAGDPLSAGMAMGDVAELARPDLKNAWLKGLPAIGTYYVRAFIDMDGDGKLSEWEPWGYVADAVTLANDGTMVEAPFVSVWIEDSDSDGDWIPDAYEYAAVGWTVPWEQLKGNKKLTSTIKTTIVSDGEVVLPFALNEKITAAAISLGLPGVSLTAMQSENFVSALLGLDLANKETIEAIFAAAKAKLDPKSVKVVAFSLTPDGKTVNLSVGADVASGISGTVIEKIYEVPASKTVKVNVKVFKKTSLDDSLWTEFYTTPNPVEITSEMYGNIEVPLGEGVDLSSGFFKVELEEVE